VAGGGLQKTASDQLSAASLLHDWLKQLYVSPTDHSPNEVHHHEGDHYWGIDSRGAAYDYHQALDGSGSGTWNLLNGLVQTDTWTAAAFNASHTMISLDATMAFSNGFTLQYHWTMNLTSALSPQTYTGTASLPSGQTMDFLWTRNPQRDTVDMTLPDASRLKFAVPLTHIQGAPFWPVFEQGLTGTYTAADGAVQHLKLTGSSAEGRWDTWAMTGDGGVQATFSLSAGLAGTGQLRQDGLVVGNLSWTEAMAGALDQIGPGSSPVWPSAAARDFQMNQWVANSAWLSPVPQY
jgi:hypothetical protein